MDLPHELKELNLLTLNCWGLPYISSHRTARLQHIGKTLAGLSPLPHVVALQECWKQEDYNEIRRATRFILPYGKFYYSGALGGGLAILSRWSIEESSMFRYPINGRPTAFWRGDWYVGKGVACAKIRYGAGSKDVLEVFNTHTHAIYPNNPYMVQRLAQAWELAKLVRGAAERGHLAVALGDFNDVPMSLPYRIFMAHAPVQDAWRAIHPDSSLGSVNHEMERARCRPIPTAQSNLVENGVTSNSLFNTWTRLESGELHVNPSDEATASEISDRRGKRLDYIFASSGDQSDAGLAWVVKNARVGMVDQHPELKCSLSDHFSVEATLELHRQSTDLDPSQTQSRSHHPRPSSIGVALDGGALSLVESRVIPNDELQNGTYLDLDGACPSIHDSQDLATLEVPSQLHVKSPRAQGSYNRLHHGTGPLDYAIQLRNTQRPITRLPPTTYDEVLEHIDKYMAREKFQRRMRTIHFTTWVLVAIVCWVGVWFSPRPVMFVLSLVAGLGLAVGTVDGLIALLFIGSEVRALKEFEWEIENARAVAMGNAGVGLFRDENGDENGEERNEMDGRALWSRGGGGGQKGVTRGSESRGKSMTDG